MISRGIAGLQTIAGAVVENSVHDDGTRALEAPGAADQAFADELFGDMQLGAAGRLAEAYRAVQSRIVSRLARLTRLAGEISSQL
jgi:hypothetical protein